MASSHDRPGRVGDLEASWAALADSAGSRSVLSLQKTLWTSEQGLSVEDRAATHFTDLTGHDGDKLAEH